MTLLLISFSQLQSQSLTTTDTVFEQSKPLHFRYAGGTGSPTDWIGIYKTGQKPGQIASTIWKYVSSPTGEIEFIHSLDTGRYDVHLFCCDGYKILASIIGFRISPARLKSRLVYYKTSDSISFYSSVANLSDTLKIYNFKEWVNGSIQPSAVALVTHAYNGNLNFRAIDLPGKYISILSAKDKTIKGIDSFEVHSNPVLPGIVTRIGVGSCSNQNAPLPVLSHALSRSIQAFIMAGDNVYIDSYDPNKIKADYNSFLTNRIEFQKLRASVPIIATWDDHDYACCDEDKDNPIKVQSQKLFLDFYDEPLNTPRRNQEGIFTSYHIGPDGKKLQIIVLDTRYFLDDKRKNNGCGQHDYCPWAGPGDATKTILGNSQWTWLKSELQKPADLRLIVSSIQFSSGYTGWEGWSLFPYEQRKMQSLIKETRADHVFFISGDIHYADVSRLPAEFGDVYPLYDFTASALNQSWPPENNRNRVDNKSYRDPNVGIIEINWAKEELTYHCIDAENTIRFKHTLHFKEISFTTVGNKAEHSTPGILVNQIPRPGQNEINLSFEQEFSGLLTLSNLNGQVLKKMELKNVLNYNIFDMDKGLFLVNLRSKNGRMQTIKTVVK